MSTSGKLSYREGKPEQGRNAFNNLYNFGMNKLNQKNLSVCKSTSVMICNFTFAVIKTFFPYVSNYKQRITSK